MWYSVEMTREDKNVGRLGVAMDLFMRNWMWLNASGDAALYCDSNRKGGGATLYISCESKARCEDFSRLFSAKSCSAPDLSSLKPLIK